MKTHHSPQIFRRTHFVPGLLCTLVLSAAPAWAATLHVPKEHKTIQAGVDAAKAGDTVLVAPGTYRERLRLKPGITLRSAGDEAKGRLGLRRAEATIIDGNVAGARGPGVSMAVDSTLDGFTVTGVGKYDDALWKKHHATQGEEQKHEHIGQPGTPGIEVHHDCTVANNIVHHIGYTGIGITGAKDRRVSPLITVNICYRNMGGGIGSMKGSTALITGNTCFQNFYAGIGHNHASPTVTKNVCYENVRAGIGVSEGAKPVVRKNKCYRNRRAGIGIRTTGETNPLVEHNDCFENDMAGIGVDEEAAPFIRHNRCHHNKKAGIGSRGGSRPVIEINDCFENEMSGIGTEARDTAAVIRGNRCWKNKMAGIGSRDGAQPLIIGNECFENKMAGIGTESGAVAVIRGNTCHHNEEAGIGARKGAQPVIEDNDCFENKLAGIGVEEDKTVALLRGNRCHDNKLSGIGIQNRAQATVVGNVCQKNKASGIGVQQQAQATLLDNQCLENGPVAIGVGNGASAVIRRNQLTRTGGMPPMVAILKGSSAVITDNTISGGGVAGALVQGNAVIRGNRFEGNGPRKGGPPNFAVWAHGGSEVVFSGNETDRWRHALFASGAKRVTATDNVASRFLDTAIVIQKTATPAHAFGNVALSTNAKDKAVSVSGPKGVVDDNELKAPAPSRK